MSRRDDPLSRREAMKHGFGALLVFAGAPALGCRRPEFTCLDTSGLTAEELKLRRDCEYVDRSPDPKKVCARCVQYIEPEDSGACGSCKIVKGPFHPDGYCKAFGAKG